MRKIFESSILNKKVSKVSKTYIYTEHLVTKPLCVCLCVKVVLETEITNSAALHLYEKLGFVRDKRLFRYYLNGVDALRLKLWLK